MPTAPSLTNVLRIEINGMPVPDAVMSFLVRASVEDRLDVPDVFSVEFLDSQQTLLQATHAEIGSRIRLLVSNENSAGGELLLSGEVTALELEHDHSGTRTTIRGYDHSHRLFRGRQTRTYQNATYSDIAMQVALGAGLTLGRIDATTPPYDHVSQANQTDWEFLRQLAGEVGREVAVVDGLFEFRTPTSSAAGPEVGSLETREPRRLVLGGDLVRLRSSVSSAHQVREVEVRAWDPGRRERLRGAAPAATTSASISVTAADLARRFGDPVLSHCDTPYDSQAQVDGAARSLSERVAAGFVDLEGVATGSTHLKAGAAISLGQVGQPFEGRYVLSGTRHVIDKDSGYRTWFWVGKSGAGGTLSPGPESPDSHAISGVVPAQVTNVRDSDGLGRVKLKFPWLSDTYETSWVRFAQFGAGSNRGAVFLPEVNDEVLVAFEHGDIRRPYVVGSLYNGVDRPRLGDGLVDESTGAVKRRGVVSKKGAALVFFDDDRDEGVAILTGDRGLRISLNKTRQVIKISSNGQIEIQGDQDIKVSSRSKISIQAGTELELKAPVVKIEASGQATVKGNPIQLNPPG